MAYNVSEKQTFVVLGIIYCHFGNLAKVKTNEKTKIGFKH